MSNLNPESIPEKQASPEEVYEKELTQKIRMGHVINPYDELKQIFRPKPGQEYFVAAFFLTPTIEEGGFRGMLYIVGTYSDPDIAKQKAQEIIEKTGVSTVIAGSTCSWHDIRDEYDSKVVHMVGADEETRLIEQNRYDYNKEIKGLKKNVEKARRIREMEKESLDPSSMEYLSRIISDTIDLEGNVKELEEEILRKKASLKKEKGKIVKTMEKNDHNIDEFLSFVKRRKHEKNLQNTFDQFSAFTQDLLNGQ